MHLICYNEAKMLLNDVIKFCAILYKWRESSEWEILRGLIFAAKIKLIHLHINNNAQQ